MALQGSGQIKLSEIATEYGGSEPHQMSEYHDKGNAPASGEIQLAADFYGTSNNWTHTITSNQQQMNLASYASGQGWDGSSAAVITVNSGVHITTGSPGTAALSTGSFPGGLTILNSGNIHGDGGNGGNAANGYGPGGSGSSAGHAIAVTNSTSLTVTNNSGGVIAGGGGGGGAGSGCYSGCRWFGGGGGGGRCGNGHTTSGGSSYGQQWGWGGGGSGSYSGAGGGGGNGAGGGNWGSGGGNGSGATWSGGSGGSGGSAVSGSYTLTANNGSMYG